jgi:hypothetical protein
MWPHRSTQVGGGGVVDAVDAFRLESLVNSQPFDQVLRCSGAQVLRGMSFWRGENQCGRADARGGGWIAPRRGGKTRCSSSRRPGVHGERRQRNLLSHSGGPRLLVPHYNRSHTRRAPTPRHYLRDHRLPALSLLGDAYRLGLSLVSHRVSADTKSQHSCSLALGCPKDR